MKIRIVSFVLACTAMLGASSCNSTPKQEPGSGTPGLEETVSAATDAYIYGYPLVTMDMTRKKFTNVAVPDAAHDLYGSDSYVTHLSRGR